MTSAVNHNDSRREIRRAPHCRDLVANLNSPCRSRGGHALRWLAAAALTVLAHAAAIWIPLVGDRPKSRAE